MGFWDFAKNIFGGLAVAPGSAPADAVAHRQRVEAQTHEQVRQRAQLLQEQHLREHDPLPDHMAEHERPHREFMEQAERDHQEHAEVHQGFMEQAEQDHQDHMAEQDRLHQGDDQGWFGDLWDGLGQDHDHDHDMGW